MKKLKLSFPALMLCVAMLMFGVYALKTAKLTANASVGFIAHDCTLSFYGTITGAVSNQDNMDRELEETFYFGDKDNQLEIEEDTVYEFKDVLSNIDRSEYYDKIYFNDAGEEIPTIVVSLYITNLSAYSVDVQLENLSAETDIEMSDQSRLNCIVDKWTGLVLLEYNLKEGVTEVANDNNFSIKLSFKKRAESQNLEYTPIYADSQTRAVNGHGASFVNDSQEIIGYSITGMGECTDTDLVLPGRHNGKLVTAIGDYAFQGQQINSVKIPPTIKTIGVGAFASCGSLKKVNIPTSITEIKDEAFVDCNDLTDVEFSSDYASDGKNYGANTTVQNPTINAGDENLPSVDDNTGSGGNQGSGGDTGSGDSGNQGGGSTGGESGGETGGESGGETGGETGGESGGSDGGNPGTGSGSGNQGGGVPSYTPPRLNIGAGAFQNCGSLSNVKLPTGTTNIGANAFDNCDSLTDIKIPTTVEKVEQGAFTGCENLEKVEINSENVTLEDNVFNGCGNLTNVEINSDNVQMGENVFTGTNIQDVVIGEDSTTLPPVAGLPFSKIEIPYGVERIEAYAFYNCENLSEVFIPSTVKYIGEYAFANCPELATIEIPGKVSYMGENVFDKCDKLESIYCKMSKEPETWEKSWIGDNYARVYFNGVLKYSKSKLMTPKDISINNFDYTISFTESLNATKYEVYLYSNGTLINTIDINKSGDSIVNDTIALATYDVSICAIGDGLMYKNSDIASAGILYYTNTELNYTKAFNFNGHTYQMYLTNDYNWDQIKSFCEYRGGHLVTITSQEEQQAIYNETKSYYNSLTSASWASFAIGLYLENGVWKWVTGEPFSYSCWQSGQPNDDKSKGYFTITKNGNWHNYNSNPSIGDGVVIVGFILEFDEIVECDDFSYSKKAEFGGSSYYLYIFDHEVNYTQSKEFCQNNGGHLATVTNQYENQMIYNLFSSYANITKISNFYMDATDISVEGSWKWNTGEIWYYSNWSQGQPDNAFDGTEDYCEYYLSSAQWNDIKSDIGLYIVLMEVDHNTTAKKVSSISYNSHKYIFYISELNWDQAKTYCENMGGHLVTITSQEEQNALNIAYNFLQQKDNIHFAFFTGGTDINKEGTWEWITGESFSYSNFRSGQPDNYGNEDYTSFCGQWNDILANGRNIDSEKFVYGFILEID